MFVLGNMVVLTHKLGVQFTFSFEYYSPSNSFMIGLARASFENKDVTFHQHITQDHNVWHYLYFIVHLKTKDTTEFTGPESYVYERIEPSFHVRSYTLIY